MLNNVASFNSIDSGVITVYREQKGELELAEKIYLRPLEKVSCSRKTMTGHTSIMVV